VTGTQFGILILVIILAALLTDALGRGYTYAPVNASRREEPKLFWSSVIVHAAIICALVVLAFVL
jgi:hypothetical protein